MIKFLVNTLFTFLCFVPFAQNKNYYNIQTFSADDGLKPFQKINNITEDNKGLIWIGTDNGLYNFDGKFFKSFMHKAMLPMSIASNQVHYNYQDKKGRYWVYVYTKGLYNFLPGDGTFKKFIANNEKEFNINQYEISLPFEDSNNNIWFGALGYGIVKYDRENNKLVPFKICFPNNCSSYNSSSWVTKILEDPLDKTFWLCTNKGLVHFYPLTGASEIIYDKTFAKNLTTQSVIISICVDDKKDIWVGTWAEGIKKLNRSTKSFTTFLPSPGKINGTKNICDGIAVKDSNSFWISSFDKGFLIFNKTTKQFSSVYDLKEQKPFLNTNSLFKSSNGTVWICNEKKLVKLNFGKNIFTFHQFANEMNNEKDIGFAGNFIKSNNKLFIGSYYNGSFYKYNLSTSSVKNLSLSNTNFRYEVNGLTKAPDGNIWLATNNGLFAFDIKSETISVPIVLNGNKNYLKYWCTAIAFDKKNNAWISTNKGLIKYNLKLKQVILFNKETVASNNLPTNNLITVFCDTENNVWVGANGFGLGCLKNNDTIFTFFNSSRNKNYAQANCTSIIENTKNEIIYTLRGEGLFILKNPFTSKEKVENINSSNALPSDFVTGIISDSKKRIWVYSSAGISLLDINKMQCTTFAQPEGILESNFDSTPYVDDDDNLYIGGKNGFQTFNTDSILCPMPITTTIHFSDFRINEKPYQNTTSNIDDGDQINLQPNENNISFQFAALSTFNNNFILYRYRLQGYDKDWITSLHNTITYTNLPAGNYYLQINTGSINGSWNEKYFSLPITIKTPWYKQTWFIGLCLLFAMFIIFSLYQYRISLIKEKLKLKIEYDKKLSEIEMKALRAQMNPHFIFNCLNSINRYIVKSDEKTASNYLTKFSKLIRLILDNSTSESISIEKEIETLKLYIEMEVLRFDNVFDYYISCSKFINNAYTEIPTMLVQPYVENAIWHGLLHKENGRGLLTINFTQPKDKVIVIQITDNGIGRQRATELKSKDALKRKSYGMQITKDRIQLINNLYNIDATVTITDLKDTANNPKGTQVTIQIPIK